MENHIEIGTRVIATEMVNEMLKKLTDNETGLYRLDPSIGEEKFDRAVKLYEKYDGYNDGMVKCAFGVQAADMISENLLKRTYEQAVKHNTRFMMHVEQGDREIEQMMKRYGKRTIQYLSELNVLTERLLAVHLTETSYSDTRYLAKKGCALIHCAGTIGLIDGINPPIGEFLEESDRVALGSDHAPGNNCNNMFNEMKLTALLNKNKYKNPAVFPAWQMLKMATIGSAKVLGIDQEVGSIREGKKADIIVVDLMKPNLSPVITYPIRNVVPNLIYAANGSEVSTVIIDGKVVVEDFQVKTVSEAEVVKEANEEAKKLAARAVSRIDADSEMMRMFKDGNL